jgi:hypothetical protein
MCIYTKKGKKGKCVHTTRRPLRGTTRIDPRGLGKKPQVTRSEHTHTLGNWLSRTRGELHPGPDSTVLCASSGDPGRRISRVRCHEGRRHIIDKYKTPKKNSNLYNIRVVRCTARPMAIRMLGCQPSKHYRG